MARKRAPKEPSLTPEQERFVDEYLVDLNGTEAYLRAFPGNKKRTTAATESWRLLRTPKIAASIRIARRDQSIRTKVTADKVLREIASIAFADVTSVLDLSQDSPVSLPPRLIPVDTRRAIAAVKVKRRRQVIPEVGEWDTEELEYKLHDKVSALDKLCKRLNLYRELPPLESVLAILPPHVASRLRAELAAAVLAGSGPTGNLAESGVVPIAPTQGRPDDPIRGDGMETRPVAASVLGRPGASPGDVVLPAGGEERDECGEDVGALFDPP